MVDWLALQRGSIVQVSLPSSPSSSPPPRKRSRRSVHDSPNPPVPSFSILRLLPIANVKPDAWEFVFMALPLLAFSVFLGVYEVVGEGILYRLAQETRSVWCGALGFLPACGKDEWDPTPGAMILFLANICAMLGSLLCTVWIVVRLVRNRLVFRRKPPHWLSAPIGLAISGVMIWLMTLGDDAPIATALFMGLLWTGLLETWRFSLAALLVPIRPVRGKRGWFGTPKRRARFAPGVETGEASSARKKM